MKQFSFRFSGFLPSLPHLLHSSPILFSFRSGGVRTRSSDGRTAEVKTGKSHACSALSVAGRGRTFGAAAVGLSLGFCWGTRLDLFRSVGVLCERVTHLIPEEVLKK